MLSELEIKYNLAKDILSKDGVPRDLKTVESIANGIKNNRFFIKNINNEISLFLTWEENYINGKKYIFVNNLWIDPGFRKSKSLLEVRNHLKIILKDVYKFYWFNRRKQRMIYRS